MTTEFRAWSIVFIGCIGSRLLSTIYYIEDLDSLRFALSMIDYDVAKLQPHFPAYPVFCCVAKLFYAATRRYALAFSLIGGLSTFFTIFFTLKIAKLQNTSLLGKITIFLVFMNPLFWLMSNRYMPDTMGVAFLLASLYFTARQAKSNAETLSDSHNAIGFLLAGMLIGIRLSYFPLLVPALVVRLKHPGRLKCIVAGVIGVLVWFVPLLSITGWTTLIAAAQTQSHGHFSDFGGAVSTHPVLWHRLTKLFESIWADGFGLYWQGRHPITVCTAIILIGIVAANWQILKRWTTEKISEDYPSFFNAILIGCAVYLVWIFLGQNVIHKSRHVLPLLPFLSLGIAFACSRIIGTQDRFRRLFAFCTVIIFFLCYSYVTLHTVVQHTKPTAIAQVHEYLRDKQNEQSDKLNIVSVPLIKYYLVSQAIEAIYISIKSEADLAQLDKLETGFVVIGSPLPNRVPKVEKVFYHNPYVNRMWSEIPLFEY
ncbi:hypothetical protein C6499_16210 [Candidatus Poribacteria bacterium]|nr:MAG: hypothetical protein C6499_16210 [Candidatus Poribacteria bacterium]